MSTIINSHGMVHICFTKINGNILQLDAIY